MHIGVWRSLVARLNGVQEAASSNLVTPTIAEPPILGQEKKEDVQARLPLFSFSLSRAALPLLSVTRLFEIVTRSCLDISISRHPLSAIAIPSLLFASLLSNLVTPTIAEPPILGQEKRKTFKHAFLFFLSPFRGRLFPLLSVTRLFEIVTRSCLDISISRHPLSAIAIPSLLFASLLTNLVTPTNAGFACRGTKKRESALRLSCFLPGESYFQVQHFDKERVHTKQLNNVVCSIRNSR